MNTATTRISVLLSILALAACGGGGGAGGGPTIPTVPDDIDGGVYADIDDRSATGVSGLAYSVLDGQNPTSNNGLSVDFSTGVITGAALNGQDFDSIVFTNPANGDYSRVFEISGERLFGVVGLDVQPGDLPTTGTLTNYNQGWVGMTAIFEDRVLTLTGDASFTTSFGASGLSGSFTNLVGQDSNDQDVNAGTIVLTGATNTGDQFAGGTVSGTGQFSGLSGSSSTSGTQGFFFGPQADELGGVLRINDAGQDIFVLGAFQAD